MAPLSPVGKKPPGLAFACLPPFPSLAPFPFLAAVALQRLLETGQVIEFKYKKQRLCLHSTHLTQQSAQVRHFSRNIAGSEIVSPVAK